MSIFGNSKILSAAVSYTLPKIHQRFLFWKKKKKEKDFVIVRAKQEDYPCIQELLWKYFYPHEPTTAALGLGHQHNPVFDDESERILVEGYSLVAKCKYNGDIIGACLNKSCCPWDPDVLDEYACNVSCPRTRELLHFYAHLQRAPCLWDKYCTHKYFELCYVFVRTDDRGKGIGILLMEAGRQLGSDCGYRVIRVDATSLFTAKICEKLKFKLVHEIPYCSYTGTGPAHEPIFKPSPPHTSVRVYVDTPFSITPK